MHHGAFRAEKFAAFRAEGVTGRGLSAVTTPATSAVGGPSRMNRARTTPTGLGNDRMCAMLIHGYAYFHEAGRTP